ncbi:helix-turn-helix domain-containing protein [Kitasatospora arboriphila]
MNASGRPGHPGLSGPIPATGRQGGKGTSAAAADSTHPDNPGSPAAPGPVQPDPGGGLASLLGLPQPGASVAQPSVRRPQQRHPASARAAQQTSSQAGSAGEPCPAPGHLLLTPEQAAALLQIPASWLRKKAAAGLIPSTLLGRHLRFSQQDLDDIIRVGNRPRNHRA